MAQIVLNLTSYVSDFVWNEKFWLPGNVTWADLQRNDSDNATFLPQPRDMLIPFPIGILLLILRFVFERFVAQPIGCWYNLKDNPPIKAKSNSILEAVFKKSWTLPGKTEILDLSKKTDMSVRQIERWYRLKRVEGKLSEMRKFKETSWRFVFYLSIFTYGICILWNKPWFWDTLHCWYNYPRQHISDDVWWYYMIELGFYWSLIFSLCIDNKRKDFKEMIVHHFATIALMVFSWVDNCVRSGTLVLAVHDAVDYWMEGAKLAKYLGYSTLCDALFVVFAIVWVITRLIIFPYRIIWQGGIVQSVEVLGHQACHNIFIALLLALLAVHIYWTLIIWQMFSRYIFVGKVEKDGRSDTEAESDGEANSGYQNETVRGSGHVDSSLAVNNNITGKCVGPARY